MKIHRFIGNYNLDQRELVLTDYAQVRQMRDILHLKKGERILLGDGKGYESEAEIVSSLPKQINFALLEKLMLRAETAAIIASFLFTTDR